jgi:ADP-ribose pyrophosphatase
MSKKPIMTGMEVLVNTRFLNMYRLDYKIERPGQKDTPGSWLMVSRKKLPALTKSFLDPQPDAVVVMALVAEEGGDELKLLITKEYRHPIQNFEYGFVAGLIDQNETVEQAAARELEEEAGLKLEKVLKVSPAIVSSAGMSDESVKIVICLASGKLSSSGQEDVEIIEPMLLDYNGVQRLCDQEGEFAHTVIAAKAWPLIYMIRQMGRITTSIFTTPEGT